jgi:glycosyltransferase involved in cell wall biosynthesis
VKEWPKTSVVIATYDRVGYLKRMLDRLLEEDDPNLEVIVADGGSKDGTVDLLESYGSRIARWVSEPDDGEYFAYNKALRLATGEVVKLMTDDDVLRPGVVRAAAEFFSANPEIGIVFGQTVFWKDVKRKPVRIGQTNVLDPARLALRHWLNESQGVMSVAGFVRRRVFEQIGPLSTDYACGDVEFWARAAAQGVRMGLISDVVVDYQITGENGFIRKRWSVARDMIRINAKYGSRRDVILCAIRVYVGRYTYLPVLVGLDKITGVVGIHPLRLWRQWRTRLAGGARSCEGKK